MALLEWYPALNTDIPEIDYQHRNLLSMLNALHTAHEAGESQTVLGDILEELELYVLNHFATEERLMDRINYQYTTPHKVAHQQLAETVRQHREAFTRGECSADDLLKFLIRWLLDHIADADSQLGLAYKVARPAPERL